MITEAEARRRLIEKALAEGDQETVLAIQREDSHVFHERWERYVEEYRLEHAQESGRAGPSNETRKKLREKRKKRKK